MVVGINVNNIVSALVGEVVRQAHALMEPANAHPLADGKEASLHAVVIVTHAAMFSGETFSYPEKQHILNF